jgi:hypothetical protein
VARDRAERIAENESLFRAANERVAGWEERERQDATGLYFCECADPQCNEKVPLRTDDYERVRRESDRFFILPGHEIPDVETVVEHHDDWAVIVKSPGVEDIVERTDPRRQGG